FDKDGNADLAVLRKLGPMEAWRNATDETTPPDTIAWQPWPTSFVSRRLGTTADLDLDTWPDLLGLPGKSEAPTVHWARNDGKRLVNRPLPLVNTQELTGFL